uniref:Fatty acyl-CoA reductase n=1 Tax=Spodoptera frugiperda TaxID=7108 RepID=A0A2H1WQP9_SPOFR
MALFLIFHQETSLQVTIIINAAATVKFDEKLSVSTAINVKGTKEVLKLAKECRNLKAITHVSTAFSNTQVKHIEEKFYEPPMSVEALEAISEVDEKLVESILPTLLGTRPNTYCFTKAVAEEAVRTYGEGLPICIVRPSIVVSTYEEPVRGWTDSVYGPTGLVIGIGTGVLRTMYMDQEKVADMVPVDLCVNAILASAWYTARNYKENQTSHIPIYNFVSGAQNPLTWGEFIARNRKYGIDKPTTKAVWYYGLNPTNNYYMFLFYNFFLHYLPALMIDTYCAVTGKRRAMLKLYSKVMKLANILFYFSTQDWKFSDMNVRNMWNSLSDADRVVFPFSIGEMSWEYMCETFLVGLRVYLIKDDLSTLPEARKKWNKDYLMVSNRRRPWTPKTLEALQLRCRPFVGYEFWFCWGIGDWGDWEGGNLASGNFTHTTKYNANVVSRRFSVSPWYNYGRADPAVEHNSSPTHYFTCTKF